MPFLIASDTGFLAQASASSTSLASYLVVVAAAAGTVLGALATFTQGRKAFKDQRKLEATETQLEQARLEQLREMIVAATEVQQRVIEGEGGQGKQVRLGDIEINYQALPAAQSAQAALANETQFEIVRKYHKLGLGQSRVSFWFSLTFASLGFFIIATAILSIDRKAGLTGQSASLIAILAGTVIDAVSALFFVQARRTQRVMEEFFEKLRSDKRQEDARELAEKVSNDHLRDQLRTSLALNLAGVQDSHRSLAMLLGIPGLDGEVKTLTTAESPVQSKE